MNSSKQLFIQTYLGAEQVDHVAHFKRRLRASAAAFFCTGQLAPFQLRFTLSEIREFIYWHKSVT
jgi:hypothetical protein